MPLLQDCFDREIEQPFPVRIRMRRCSCISGNTLLHTLFFLIDCRYFSRSVILYIFDCLKQDLIFRFNLKPLGRSYHNLLIKAFRVQIRQDIPTEFPVSDYETVTERMISQIRFPFSRDLRGNHHHAVIICRKNSDGNPPITNRYGYITAHFIKPLHVYTVIIPDSLCLVTDAKSADSCESHTCNKGLVNLFGFPHVIHHKPPQLPLYELIFILHTRKQIQNIPKQHSVILLLTLLTGISRVHTFTVQKI